MLFRRITSELNPGPSKVKIGQMFKKKKTTNTLRPTRVCWMEARVISNSQLNRLRLRSSRRPRGEGPAYFFLHVSSSVGVAWNTCLSLHPALRDQGENDCLRREI